MAYGTSSIYSEIQQVRKDFREYVRKKKFNMSTAYRLLKAIEEPWNSDVSRTLFYLLFSVPNDSFLNLLSASCEPVSNLVECDSGDIEIYGYKFRKESIVKNEN